jgi:hypothetical protein
MYKTTMETIVKEYRYDQLTDEVREVIVASWKRGGLLLAAAIERMIPTKLCPRHSTARRGKNAADRIRSDAQQSQ